MAAASSNAEAMAKSSALAAPPAFSIFLSPLTLRLRDISSFQLPRLTSSSSSNNASSSSAISLFDSYETELLAALSECATLVEEGQYLVEDLCQEVAFEQGGREQVQMIQGEWRRVREQFDNATVSSRAALLQGRKTLAERKEKGLLISGRGQNGHATGDTSPVNYATAAAAAASKSKRQKSQSNKRGAAGGDESLLASEDLTSALRQTVGLLSDSLTQSAFSAELLEESTNSLSTLSFDYATFSDLVKNSGGILKSMERQDKIDALMLLGAYLFFAFCVGYILKVRIWDRGVSFFAFLFRLVGLGGLRGGADVKQKLQLAKEAAKSVAEKSPTASKAAAEVAAAVSTTLAGAVTTAFNGAQKANEEAAAAAVAASTAAAVPQKERSWEKSARLPKEEAIVDGGADDIHINIEDRPTILEEVEELASPPSNEVQDQDKVTDVGGDEEAEEEQQKDERQENTEQDEEADGEKVFYEAEEPQEQLHDEL
ncbi:Sec20-domain-containing protein [Microstroma glucosiphilum]|uniref:Sec20-domain-containing protein n=1 Tax=Pseudomicrostroma glucosiphilum TaxID=1684307 RepID=A0A316UAK9_9BASI|nr:Sec20-domain-containing protein [Pseudomicrostroma glucosiphilum]PWN21453.1 Sec20-domain-containing protein [Pseudomicrostroma glucosiphilum]